MDLIHNGRAERIEPAQLATVGAVLAACTESGEHVLLSLRLDGCEIDEAEHAAIAGLSTDAAGKLEVESRPLRAVARDGLESAAAYAGEVAAAFGRMAALLREGRIERARALFRDCLDAVGVLLQAVQSAAEVLGPVAAQLAALEPALERRVAALERHFVEEDWVAVADCVEFEVAAEIAQWPASLVAVRRAAEEER